MIAVTWPPSPLRPIMPSSKFLERPPHIETGEWIDPVGAADIGSRRIVPIWRIESKHQCLRLSRPILVRIRVEDGFFFAGNETLRIFGTGQSERDALRDFSKHVLHFVQYYGQLPDSKLTGDARRLKLLFAGLLAGE